GRATTLKPCGTRSITTSSGSANLLPPRVARAATKAETCTAIETASEPDRNRAGSLPAAVRRRIPSVWSASKTACRAIGVTPSSRKEISKQGANISALVEGLAFTAMMGDEPLSLNLGQGDESGN